MNLRSLRSKLIAFFNYSNKPKHMEPKRSIGYFNHNPYPIQFNCMGSPRLVAAGDPIVDADNRLTKPGNPALDKAVENGLLSMIAFDNPKFKEWDLTAEKHTKKPLPAGPDGHPISDKPRVAIGSAPNADVNPPSVSVSNRTGQTPAEDLSLADLRDPIERDRVLAIARNKITSDGSVSFDGKEFRSFKSLEKYVETSLS